jgi:hypothetical protein
MKVPITMSLIALGVAFGIVDKANATNEASYQNSSPAIEPKLKYDARIIGSDGSARTPSQHAYWIARHLKEQQRLPTDAISSPAAERHSFQSEPCLAKLGPTGLGQAQKHEIESAKYLTKVCRPTKNSAP